MCKDSDWEETKSAKKKKGEKKKKAEGNERRTHQFS